jgi:hypothetical protein
MAIKMVCPFCSSSTAATLLRHLNRHYLQWVLGQNYFWRHDDGAGRVGALAHHQRLAEIVPFC